MLHRNQLIPLDLLSTLLRISFSILDIKALRCLSSYIERISLIPCSDLWKYFANLWGEYPISDRIFIAIILASITSEYLQSAINADSSTSAISAVALMTAIKSSLTILHSFLYNKDYRELFRRGYKKRQPFSLGCLKLVHFHP